MTVRSQLHPLGYLHRNDLVDLGWRPDRIRRAIDAEGLVLLRRQWVIAPDAAPPAVALAAASGGRLTCVSAAALRGLWRPGHDDTVHLWIPAHSGVRCPNAHIHRSTGPAAAHPRSLIEPVENLLATAALCLGRDDARTVWESALRQHLVTREHLQAVPWRGTRARELAADVTGLSDSGIETLAVSRLARAGVAVRQQVPLAGHDVDGLVGTHLVLQFDGFAHHRASDRRRDIAHDRRLRLLGYTVLRYDYHEIVNEWPRVEREILAAIAQGLHLSPHRG
ncbi:endonuclease domain-containing protein [Microbacterium sp. 18062]|uniref:endonuclease domain-containing protein n=1 Tax=Microbacterium sp. 18062 TaxID=2681410 RepID=UPI001357CA12|nr:DUF559 domain-containing protein [Microbacterium sp. 18062]